MSRFACLGLSVALVLTSLSTAGAQDIAPLPLPKPEAVGGASDVMAEATLPPIDDAPVQPPSGKAETAPIVMAALQHHERAESRIGDSGLPVPRFVSLKSGEVYLREGPSSQHKVQWVYVRRGLPVEVIAEYDVWRRIRDVDGIVGWVHKGMLDGRRSVMVTGTDNIPMREAPSSEAAVMAYAQPGVIAKLKSCNESYCEVEAKSVDAFVSRSRIWGVYDSETIE